MKKTFFTLLIITLILLTGVDPVRGRGSLRALAASNGVDLIWEAETYTPVGYRGRSIPTPGSLVRIVAIPHILDSRGQSIKLSNLNFNWRKDGVEARSASGAGKNSFDYRALSQVGTENVIELTVVKPDRAVGASAITRIPVSAPKVVFYQVKDGVIDYHTALKGLAIATDQIKIIAEPFFFSKMDWLNRRLTFNWLANKERIAPATEDPRLLTIVTNPDRIGEALIGLKITNANQLGQTAERNLPIKFGVNSFEF